DIAFYDDKYGGVLSALIRGLGLDDTFHTWWFRVLLVLVFTQILLCSVGRFRTAWVQATRPGDFVPDATQERVEVSASLEEVTARAVRVGYRPAPSSRPGAAPGTSATSSVTLVRGRLQPLGFILLHVSLLALLAGMAWNLSLGFSEAVYLPEGQRVLEPNTNRLLELVDLEPRFQKVRDRGDDTDYELAGMRATVAVYEGGRRLEEGSFELGGRLGFDRGDLVLQPSLGGSQVVFRVTSPQGNAVVERLSFAVPVVSLSGGDGLQLRVLDFARDAESTVEGWRRRSPEMRDPLAAVAVVREAGDGSQEEVARSDLRIGEELTAEDYTVTFLEAVYMPTAVVSSRAGGGLVLGGIVANLLGVVLSLGFSFRQVRLTPVAGGIEVTGFARRRNQPLAEELARLKSAGASAEREADGSPDGAGRGGS
ncbi:MAG: cytochrome c biogenesis protein ResB, partial [Actinobacteria bacterium]|nr:cytochrome c biogenesis protein ResB [Actinomycetota bacterium]